MSEKEQQFSDKLKPCPFCGNTTITYCHIMHISLYCAKCGITTEGFKNKQTLNDYWNSRAKIREEVDR